MRYIVKGILRWLVPKHGEHIGQEGTPEGGSQPGYTHVPGSIPGHGQVSLGGTADTGQEHPDDVRSAHDEFADIITSLRGTDMDYYGEAEGGWRGEEGLVTEISLAMDLKANDEAIDTFKVFLRENDQSAGLVWGVDAEGDAGVGTIWSFENPVSRKDRDALATAMDGLGIGGWTWRLIGGRESLVVLSVPQWGGTPEAHFGQMVGMAEHLSGTDLNSSKKDFRTNIQVLQSGEDY